MRNLVGLLKTLPEPLAYNAFQRIRLGAEVEEVVQHFQLQLATQNFQQSPPPPPPDPFGLGLDATELVSIHPEAALSANPLDTVSLSFLPLGQEERPECAVFLPSPSDRNLQHNSQCDVAPSQWTNFMIWTDSKAEAWWGHRSGGRLNSAGQRAGSGEVQTMDE
jgi:hypothetical protein